MRREDALQTLSPAATSLRAVIFEVGGVLLHRDESERLRAWEERLGLAPGGLACEVFAFPTMRRALLGLAAEADAWMELACLYRLHADEMRALADDFWACERLDAELLAFMRSLRPRFRIGLLSNAGSGARAVWETRFGLCGAVDAVVISAEERLVKPDTRIYELAAARLGVAPDESLFVDDSAEHVAGARDAGMQALQFACRAQIIAAIESILHGDHRRDSLDATPRAVASGAGSI
jgi:putative hydrolase of the HAD superfamily